MKIRARENFRVIVIPGEPLFLEKENLGMTEKNFRRLGSACEEIVSDIKRHIDGYIDVYQESDSKDICSFCELVWEEEDNGQPLCCEKAIEEWRNAIEQCPPKND